MGLATPHQFLGPFGNLKQHVFCKSDPTGLLKGSRSPLSQSDRRTKIQAPRWWVGPFYFEQKHSEDKSTLVPAATQRATRSPRVAVWSLSCARWGNGCHFETARLTLRAKILILIIGKCIRQAMPLGTRS